MEFGNKIKGVIRELSDRVVRSASKKERIEELASAEDRYETALRTGDVVAVSRAYTKVVQLRSYIPTSPITSRRESIIES